MYIFNFACVEHEARNQPTMRVILVVHTVQTFISEKCKADHQTYINATVLKYTEPKLKLTFHCELMQVDTVYSGNSFQQEFCTKEDVYCNWLCIAWTWTHRLRLLVLFADWTITTRFPCDVLIEHKNRTFLFFSFSFLTGQ